MAELLCCGIKTMYMLETCPLSRLHKPLLAHKKLMTTSSVQTAVLQLRSGAS